MDRQALLELANRAQQAIREGGVAPAQLIAQLAVVLLHLREAEAQARFEKAQVDRDLEDIQTQAVARAGGWAALGKNNDERDMNLRAMLANDERYVALRIRQMELEDAIRRHQAAADYVADLISSLRNSIRARLADALRNPSHEAEDLI